jgi:hypothetical protein
MNRSKTAGLIGVVVVAAYLGYFHIAAPFLWSESRLREKVLSQTPIGSTHEQVLKTIELQGWLPMGRNQAVVENHGYLQQFDGAPPVSRGVTSIAGYLGAHYESILTPTHVSAYWGFGKDGRLTDVWIWKVTDSISHPGRSG